MQILKSIFSPQIKKKLKNKTMNNIYLLMSTTYPTFKKICPLEVLLSILAITVPEP